MWLSASGEKKKMKKARKVGIIGFGAIGQEVADALLRVPGADYSVVVLMRRPDLPVRFEERLSATYTVADFLAMQPDIIVEAAGQAAVREYGFAITETGIPFVVSSIGAFADEALHSDMIRRISARGGRILLPTGAIGGLDYIRAIAGLPDARVTYVSRKPPAAWRDELHKLGRTPEDVAEEVVLFEGNAMEAAQRYPKNLNVAATLAVAGLGMERTGVTVMIDPAISVNIHEVEVESCAGIARFRFENLPSEKNPKTSMVTALSVISAVRTELE